MYTLQYQKPPCDFLPLLLHSFTYPMVPSVTKYVLFSSNRVGFKSLEMCTDGPVDMAKAPIEHILPSVNSRQISMDAPSSTKKVLRTIALVFKWVQRTTETIATSDTKHGDWIDDPPSS